MEYTREYWQPRIATNPNRFRKLNESNDYVELINEPEAITQAGTANTAARLNNMESGITGAVAGVNEIQGVLDLSTVVNTFSGLSQTSRLWHGMTTRGNDVYACVLDGDIYKQTNGVGDFIALGQESRRWRGMTTRGNDVYACVQSGDIYKQTNGTGDFIALGQESRQWNGMTTRVSDVYACVYANDIYKQTGGVGDFIALGQTPILWYGMTTLGNDVYACVTNGDIYKQTNGTGDFIALGQESRDWRGMTTRKNDVYACVANGDIYKQTNGTGDFIALGQATRIWQGMTTRKNDVYACVANGDIYTATILTGNTFRASSSFTLPAMPDGARKRILNTHPTTAITVTAYSGTTIEGQATMTLSAGHEVELELIGTDWKKTGWNEKSLASFVGPVDCTSRVAEYTGDGIPLIPDNVAETVFIRDGNWDNLDGWLSSNATVSYVNGKLILTATANFPQIYQTNYSSYSGKELRYRIKKISGSATMLKILSGGAIKTSTVTTCTTIFDTVVLPTLSANLVLNFEIATVGDVYEIETLYIGTGAYDTPALDRAGNGNSLALTAVTPVNGKFYKEMSFNGVTSFGVDKSPVVGISGTLIMRWKRNRIGTAETIISNQSATTDGLRYHIDESNNLYAIIGGASPVSILIKSGFTDTASSHTFGIRFSATSATPFFDGVDGTPVSATQVLGLANFAIGRNQIDSTGYASGQGFVRYDSRIWTADEARAWSLNPISIDSRL